MRIWIEDCTVSAFGGKYLCPLEALSGGSITIRQAEEKLRECGSHGLYDSLATNVKRQQTLVHRLRGFEVLI